MVPFSWSVHNEVFLPEIDAEHRALFQGGQELQRLLAAEAPVERIRECLNHVAQLAESHFQHEERLMRESQFVSLDWHIQQHDHLRRLSKEVDAADMPSLRAFVEHVGTWLHDHTTVADRIMAAHVRNWSRTFAA